MIMLLLFLLLLMMVTIRIIMIIVIIITNTGIHLKITFKNMSKVIPSISFPFPEYTQSGNRELVELSID